MNKHAIVAIALFIILVGSWYIVARQSELPVDNQSDSIIPQLEDSDLTRAYSNSRDGFSIRLAEGYVIDESYQYQMNPGTIIHGVKFTIPTTLAEGTNLADDSYVSVENIPKVQQCTASIFLDGTHVAEERTEFGTIYSVASATGAGAGNRYEETVYAIPGTNPCIAIRYLIHYGVIQNYEPGMVEEFDKQALLKKFDRIRSTLDLGAEASN